MHIQIKLTLLPDWNISISMNALICYKSHSQGKIIWKITQIYTYSNIISSALPSKFCLIWINFTENVEKHSI